MFSDQYLDHKEHIQFYINKEIKINLHR